jgi:hypothetical protein
VTLRPSNAAGAPGVPRSGRGCTTEGAMLTDAGCSGDSYSDELGVEPVDVVVSELPL